MVNNSLIRSEIKDLISTLRSSYNTIENHLAPSAGKAFPVFGGLLPGAGTAIFASAVNTIRPVGFKLSSCADKLEGLSREIEELENELDRWKNKYNDLRDDDEKLNREYKTKNNQLISEQTKNARNEASLEQQRDDVNNINIKLSRELQDAKNELSLVRTEKDNQLTQKNNEIRRIEGELADLRVEHGRELAEKNNQLNEKERELKLKEKVIELLRNQKGLTQEELLTEKLRFEKNNLELFSARLGISLEQINNLSKSHERLFMDRKVQNQTSIDLHEENIAQVKQNFLSWGFDIIDIREICQKCERIAQLSWELTQIQQQYQTQQEVPVNH